MTPTRVIPATEGFRRWSAVYDDEANPMLSLERRYLGALLPPVGGRDAIDLGCGTGRWLQTLALESPHTLIGIDVSEDMLGRAKKKLAGSADLLVGSCEALPIESASADLVLCSFVLSYITDLDQCIDQIRRLARPDADVYVTDLHPQTERKFAWRRGFRKSNDSFEIKTQWRSLDSVLAAFERKGFQTALLLEPRFGAPERQILRRAGRAAAVEAFRQDPAIYLLHLRKAPLLASDGRRHNKRGCIGSMRGCRVAFGPAEAMSCELEITGGWITGLSGPGRQSAVRRMDPSATDLSGYLLLPGLVNAHDHLEFALFPRLGRGGYRNFRDWANDIYRPDASPVREHRFVPKDVRLWWGAIRNLLCGVTTVCHHNPYVPEVFDGDFPVRVVRDFGWAHSLALDSDVPEKHARTPGSLPFILHLAEGTDAGSSQELAALDGLGALTERTVLVHGLALDPNALSFLKRRGGALVWCPTSNTFLFGQTHSPENLRTLPFVALGSDSSLTAAGDLLDEVRFAYRPVGLTAVELYTQVTQGAAHVLRLRIGEGSLRVGAVADLIAIRDKGLAPAKALVRSTFRDVEFVVLGGQVQLASRDIKARLAPEDREGLEPLNIDGEIRWIRAPLARLFEEARRFLGPELRLNGRLLSYGGE